jgi:hypothetical protein
MHPRRLAQVVAIVLLGALVANWRLVSLVLNPADATAFLVVAGWVGLLLASAIGLVQGKRWGAYALLALVPYSTILLSTPLIPAIDQLATMRGWLPLTVVNLVVLMAGGFLASRLGRQTATA